MARSTVGACLRAFRVGAVLAAPDRLSDADLEGGCFPSYRGRG